LGFERVDADADGSVDDLLISLNNSTIKVINQYSGTTADAVEEIVFTNGGTFGGYLLGTGVYELNTDGTSPLDGANVGGGTIGNRDVVASSTTGETLNGGAGNDLMFGNGGNDILTGGGGSDLLVGGGGNDKFVYTAASDSVPGTTGGIQNYDVI